MKLLSGMLCQVLESHVDCDINTRLPTQRRTLMSFVSQS